MTQFRLWMLAASLLVFVAGCDGGSASAPPATDSVIPDIFSYETTHPVDVALQVRDTEGTPVPNVPLRLFSDAGKTEVLVTSGATDEAGRFEVRLSRPVGEQALIARSSYLGIADSVRIPIRGGRVTHTFGGSRSAATAGSSKDAPAVSPTSKAAGALRPSFLGPYDDQGVPLNQSSPAPITAEFLASINDALPEQDPVPQAHPEYLATNNETSVALTDSAEVWITFVHEGAGFRNTFGFYTYEAGNPPSSPAEIDTHTVVFPNLSFEGSGGGLQSGDRVRLGAFSPGTKIGWFLIANGWTGSGIGEGNHVVYSDPELNPEGDAALRQHNVLLNDTRRDLVLLGFEDMRRDGGSDDDFNDALFYVTSNPITAIDRSALPETDLDPGDEAPPTRTYQPGRDQFATLAFEDLWPAAGDYDFNDMVVDYNVATRATPSGDVTELTATFVTRAVGASFANGFGFALPIEPSAVEQVSGTDLREGIVTTRPNGTEAGTDDAVIVVYDNVHNRTSRAGGFFNTDPAVPYRPPDTIRVEITFQPAVPPAQLGTAPYNPFIFVNGDRSREVHLPDAVPTAKASTEWFGQSQDASDPGAERFYKTRTNRPWALHLPSSFRYPKEKVGIRSGYLHFQDWAESGGQQSQDWHSNTAPDYRRPEKLYSHP